MSSTTAGTVTAASPTSSYAKGRPRSRGRPSARPLPNLGSAAGRWDPGVDGGWAAGLGVLGRTAAGQRAWGPGVDGVWAPGSATASCSPGHVVLAPPHCEDRRAGRQGATRSPARVSPHDDLHNRRPLQVGSLRGRAGLTPRRIHGREDRRAGLRGGARLTARLRAHDDLHEWMPRWAVRYRSRARPRMPQWAVPSTDHVRRRTVDRSRTPPGVRGRGRRPADQLAATRSSPYAVARRGSCQEALSPLGLGSSHTAAGPSGRSCRPTWAPGCPVAHR